MNPEPSLRSATLRAIAFLLGGSLAFVGLLCGAILLVSLSVSGSSSQSESATPTSVDPSPGQPDSPGGKGDRRGLGSSASKKPGTSI